MAKHDDRSSDSASEAASPAHSSEPASDGNERTPEPTSGETRRDTAESKKADTETGGYRQDGSSDASDGIVNTLGVGTRLVLDAVVIALWVLFLALLFLGRTWPRWAFYVALVVGVAVYVNVTAPWTRGRAQRD
ncbi:hypothetical protein [Natrialba swarupiae]|uniref:hypothetical protein n=1 Tax=Natrialba swarupiae TaxID=2448032 RepID=UPI003082D8F8